VGRGCGGTASSHFFRQRGRVPPLPPLFAICYGHSNTSSCIAGQDQRSAVAIYLTFISVRVCRPKLFKNLCLSLVSGVPHFFFRTTPLVVSSPSGIRGTATAAVSPFLHILGHRTLLAARKIRFSCPQYKEKVVVTVTTTFKVTIVTCKVAPMSFWLVLDNGVHN